MLKLLLFICFSTSVKHCNCKEIKQLLHVTNPESFCSLYHHTPHNCFRISKTFSLLLSLGVKSPHIDIIVNPVVGCGQITRSRFNLPVQSLHHHQRNTIVYSNGKPSTLHSTRISGNVGFKNHSF